MSERLIAAQEENEQREKVAVESKLDLGLPEQAKYQSGGIIDVGYSQANPESTDRLDFLDAMVEKQKNMVVKQQQDLLSYEAMKAQNEQAHQQLAKQVQSRKRRIQEMQRQRDQLIDKMNNPSHINHNKETTKTAEVIDNPPQSPTARIRKLNSGFIYNVNELKSKSFVIHPSKKQKAASKEQIEKINDIVNQLQNKLEMIEKEQNEKEIRCPLTVNQEERADVEQAFTMTRKDANDKNSSLQLPRLKLQASIYQINNLNPQMKEDIDERAALKQEISRLREAIRSMQIEKIRSKDEQNQSSKRSSNNRLQDAGKIIHLNSSSLQNSRSAVPRNSSNNQHRFLQSSRIIESSQFVSMPSQRDKIPNKTGSKARFLNESEGIDQNSSDISMLQVNFRDIQSPSLPKTPSANMNQEQLMHLAKETYLTFDLKVQEDRQLIVKKYKNCVLFSLVNQPNQTILWHYSGKFYMGGWKIIQNGQGEKDGEGFEITPGKSLYKGQFLNGKKNGTGIMKATNGSIYDGQWVEGNKNGRGVYFDAATKAVYNGQWKDNKKEGQGFLKVSDRNYYYGTFLKSIKEGFGQQCLVNGDRYRGEYKNGKFHGKGRYLWANGSCYEGQFEEGFRHGQGSWKSSQNNGDLYIGGYERDKKNGYGRYIWANGCTYEGEFSNDVKHGKGRLTYLDGNETKGVWKYGVLTAKQGEKAQGEHEQRPLQRAVRKAPSNFMSPSRKASRV